MIKFSFIIPHFNIPKLLIRCVESIPEREDIQVIIVDDCSPNAATYKEKFPKIFRKNVEFHTTSKGGSAGRARNVGIQYVKGKWMSFIDADDLYVSGFLDLLFPHYEDEEEILFFRTQSVYSNDLNKPSKRSIGNQKIYDDYLITKDESKIRYDNSPLWGKVYKTEMIVKNHILCDETPFFNDAGFSLRAGIQAKKIKVMQETIYLLTDRPGSLAHLYDNSKTMSLQECEIRFNVAYQNYKLAKEKGLAIKPNVQIHIDHFRAYHKLAYLKLMGKILFTQPELFYAEINNFISLKYK